MIPAFIYGTAWKEERTEALVRLALEQGFTAIDTANQRKHYFEAAVGAGIAGQKREDLFLQTKFTYVGGQDHRLPYDPQADLPTQVRQSFASSLEHLRTTYVDSYVLHGPSVRYGLGEADVRVWKTMEALQREGKTRVLGVSNVLVDQLEELWGIAEVKPAFVQNRCFASDGWDADVRAFCRDRGIRYQGFSLLTANVREIQSPAVVGIAKRRGRTLAQIVFRFAVQVGMIPLTGTSSAQHMREDLAVFDFELGDDEIRTIERAGL